MWKIEVHTGDSPSWGYLLESGSDKPKEYDNPDEAYRDAKNLRAESSIGVWCRVVEEPKSA